MVYAGGFIYAGAMKVRQPTSVMHIASLPDPCRTVFVQLLLLTNPASHLQADANHSAALTAIYRSGETGKPCCLHRGVTPTLRPS